MATELLKDSRDNVLGSIETGDDGGQVLRDANGKIRGYYDPTTDHTRGPTSGYSPRATYCGR